MKIGARVAFALLGLTGGLLIPNLAPTGIVQTAPAGC